MRRESYDTSYYQEINEQTVDTMRAKYGRFLSYLAPDRAPAAALDLGCGSGTLCAVLAERFPGARVAGLDLSDIPLREAASRYPAITFRQGDLCQGDLPFEAASFDLITAHEVLEHLTDPLAFLASVKTLLRPGGALLLKTPNALDLSRLSARLRGRVWYADQDHTHVCYYSVFSGARLLRQAGFQRVRAFTGTRRSSRLPWLPAVPVVGLGLVLRAERAAV